MKTHVRVSNNIKLINDKQNMDRVFKVNLYKKGILRGGRVQKKKMDKFMLSII